MADLKTNTTRFAALRSAVRRAKAMGLGDLRLTLEGALVGFKPWEGTVMMVNYPVVEIINA